MSFDLVPVKRPTTGELFIPPEVKTGVGAYRGRPRLSSNFFCAKCGKIPDEFFCYAAETGVEETAKMTPEQIAACRKQGLPIFDCGRGYLHGGAKCHGEQLEFIATFDQAWMAIDSRKPIVIFDQQSALPEASQEKLCKPAASPRIPLGD